MSNGPDVRVPAARGANGEQRGREKQKGEAGAQPERKLGPGSENFTFLSRTWNSLIIFEKYVFWGRGRGSKEA